nr:putative reverse transcriptase domain-containing protein [Tanacetum cinerariifolium]
MESVFHISNCVVECQVKFATWSLLNGALTWWNSHVRTVGIDATYGISWEDLIKTMTKELALLCPKMVPDEEEKVKRYVWGLLDIIQGNVISAGPVGDKVMLNVSPWKRVIRFGKQGKLNPRYVGPFKVLAKVGTVAYRLKLSQQLKKFHITLHMSYLKNYTYDESLVIPLDEIQIDDKLHFVEEHMEIIDQEVK